MTFWLGNRVNRKVAYESFKLIAPSKYAKELHDQNALDIELYHIIVNNMCMDLHRLGLWQSYDVIKTYWGEHSKHKTELCP